MSKKRRASVGYEGILLKPLQLIAPTSGDDQTPIHSRSRGHDRLIHNQAVADVNDRMAALWQHYGIRPGCWKTLALALAFDHVAGFSTAPALKRKAVETTWHLFMYYDFIMDRKKGTGLSVSAICRMLPNDPEFRKRFPDLRNTKTKERLQNLFSMAQAKGAADAHGFRTTPSPMFLRFAKGGLRSTAEK